MSFEGNHRVESELMEVLHLVLTIKQAGVYERQKQPLILY